jgi:uncharacterized protein YejL (UPF0352 family)
MIKMNKEEDEALEKLIESIGKVTEKHKDFQLAKEIVENLKNYLRCRKW